MVCYSDYNLKLQFHNVFFRIETTCPQCHSKATRETDTFDTFFDSSWYFLRYYGQPCDHKPFGDVAPVYCYIGGKEHAALHLFYARFITHFLHSKNLIQFKEPFTTLLMQAIVKGRTYKLNGKYISQEEAENAENVEVSYEKMSKSKGTGVNPDLLVEQYGSDAVRWTMTSVGNPESERLWNTNESEFGPTLVFFHRILLTIEEYIKAKKGQAKLKSLSETNQDKLLNKLNQSIDESVFNVLYSLTSSYQIRNGTTSIHKLINALRSNINNPIVLSPVFERGLGSLLILISPFTPCFAEECWQAYVESVTDSQYLKDKFNLDLSKKLCEQVWPKPINPEFTYIVRITYRNENGREKEYKRLRIPMKSLKTWSESEIQSLMDISNDQIEWIDIVKHCSIVVRLKHPPRDINDDEIANE